MLGLRFQTGRDNLSIFSFKYWILPTLSVDNLGTYFINQLLNHNCEKIQKYRMLMFTRYTYKYGKTDIEITHFSDEDMLRGMDLH